MTCQPAVSCVMRPSGETSSTLAATIPSLASVERNSRAAIVPPTRSPAGGLKSYEIAVVLLALSSVSHGVLVPAPAVHCTVERVQTPLAGLYGIESGSPLPAFRASSSFPGEPGDEGPDSAKAL